MTRATYIGHCKKHRPVSFTEHPLTLGMGANVVVTRMDTGGGLGTRLHTAVCTYPNQNGGIVGHLEQVGEGGLICR